MQQSASDERATLTAVFSADVVGGSELFNLEFLRVAAPRGVDIRAIVPGRGTLSDALRDLAREVIVVEAPSSIRALSRFDRGGQILRSARQAGAAMSYMARLRRGLGGHAGPICCFGFRAQLAVGLQPRIGRPVGWVVHEVVPEGPYARLWRLAALGASQIWAFSSTAACQPALRRLPVHIGKVRLDLDPYASIPMPVWPPRRLGLVGDLFPIKNHMGLIDVVHELRARGVPAEGLLVGRPSTNSGAHKRYAESLVEITRDPDVHVRLLSATPAEMPRLIAEIDTLLHLTTVPETFGRVCVEAMAAGRPVVAFNHGAVADVVGSGGVLCPPGDLDSVVDAVATLWSDPAAYGRGCALARETAIAEYGSNDGAPTIGDYMAEFALSS